MNYLTSVAQKESDEGLKKKLTEMIQATRDKTKQGKFKHHGKGKKGVSRLTITKKRKAGSVSEAEDSVHKS